jgi:hypothetical protein
MKTTLLAFAGMLAYLLNSTVDAVETRHCSAAQASDVSAVGVLLDAEIQNIADQLSFVSQRNRDELVRKWPKIVVRCRERFSCRDDGHLGVAFPGPGNLINICHASEVESGHSRCDLAGNMVHEFGHANGFPQLRGHNRPDATIFTTDPIYLMGFAARDHCRQVSNAGGFIDAPLLGSVGAPLGAACSNNLDCRSKTCRRDRCVCNDDGDCPGSQTCITLGENVCEDTQLPNGASCRRNRQCASDNCRLGTCKS